MSYEMFQSKIHSLINKAGGGISVEFSSDADTGRHFANCSDGTTIIGNQACMRVEVRWGSGHKSLATV